MTFIYLFHIVIHIDILIRSWQIATLGILMLGKKSDPLSAKVTMHDVTTAKFVQHHPIVELANLLTDFREYRWALLTVVSDDPRNHYFRRAVTLLVIIRLKSEVDQIRGKFHISKDFESTLDVFHALSPSNLLAKLHLCPCILLKPTISQQNTPFI